jgi:Ni/Fe-hydrogenase 1 B-type cytochrome subunit
VTTTPAARNSSSPPFRTATGKRRPPQTPHPELISHRPPVHPDVIVGSASVSAVKVWQTWIRILHWTLVTSVVFLSVTGFYIGNPVLDAGPGWSLMSLARTTHLICAWVFIAVLIGRLFLAFSGNPWARWDQLVPWRTERRQQLRHTLRYYLFLEKEPAPVVGHNPMAGMAYLALFAVLIAQTFSGIALMASQDNTGGWQSTLTSWFSGWLPLTEGRFVHHLLMWVIWTFVITHVYAATLSDRIERSGEISSMIGGWKLLPQERVTKELARDADRRRRRYTR